MSPLTKKLRSEELVWRDINGEIIAIDIVASEYLGTNPAGTLLWQMLVDGSDAETLTKALVSRYGIDWERAKTDVDTFLQSLETRNLLTP